MHCEEPQPNLEVAIIMMERPEVLVLTPCAEAIRVVPELNVDRKMK